MLHLFLLVILLAAGCNDPAPGGGGSTPIVVFNDPYASLDETARAWLTDPKEEGRLALLRQSETYLQAHPGSSWALYLLAYALEQGPDPTAARGALARMEPDFIAAYEHFFRHRPTELRVYFDFNALERCLRQEGRLLPEGPGLQRGGHQVRGQWSCGGLTLDLDTRPADHRLFQRLAHPDNDMLRVAAWSDDGEPSTPEELGRMLGIQEGMRVLDLGAGHGYFTFPFARLVAPGGQVLAVEIDEVMLDFLEERKAREAADDVTLIRGRPKDVGVQAHVADLAFMCSVVFDIIPNDDGAGAPVQWDSATPLFESLLRALRPGGRLVVIDEYQARPDTPPKLDPQRVIETLEGVGFTFLRANDEFMPRMFLLQFQRPQTGDARQP